MDNIVKYFEGEKAQCILGILISLGFIGTSIYFLYLQQQMLKGMAYVFLLFSALLVSICVGVVLRSPKDMARVTGFYQDKLQKMQSVELPRMEKVMRNFNVIKKVEIFLVLAGLVLFLFFGKNDLAKGIALGLLVQGVVLYLFDHFAEARGKAYFEFLKTF